MKIAIMQPYFFPYIGYFQLIHAVDAFVIYDDVNYIQRGWINRNYILNQGKTLRLTLQLQGASQNRLINQITVGGNKEKLAKTIESGYAKAPYFNDGFSVLRPSLLSPETDLTAYLSAGLQQLCRYFDIQPNWYLSSEIEKNNALKGQDKILAICKQLAATEYINPPGGRQLYAPERFAEAGIKLLFIEPHIRPYLQLAETFEPSLSIIDVMLNNSQQQCREMMKEYDLG